MWKSGCSGSSSSSSPPAAAAACAAAAAATAGCTACAGAALGGGPVRAGGGGRGEGGQQVTHQQHTLRGSWCRVRDDGDRRRRRRHSVQHGRSRRSRCCGLRLVVLVVLVVAVGQRRQAFHSPHLTHHSTPPHHITQHITRHNTHKSAYWHDAVAAGEPGVRQQLDGSGAIRRLFDLCARVWESGILARTPQQETAPARAPET
jgi:hypothetical protein